MLLPHKQTMISHQPFQTVTITTIKYEYKTNINRSIQGITNLHCSTSKGSSHRPNIHLLIVLIFVIFLFRHTATLLFLQPICFSYQTKTNVTHSITYKTPYRHHHSSVQKQYFVLFLSSSLQKKGRNSFILYSNILLRHLFLLHATFVIS